MKKLIMIASIVAVVALAVLNLTFSFEREPDVVFPIANSGITWNTSRK